MATDQELRAALARANDLQKQLALADRGWQLLGRSRSAFISSLRHTGLSYAHAQIKFDDFVEEQRRLYEHLAQALQAAQDHHMSLQDAAEVDEQSDPRPAVQSIVSQQPVSRP